MAIFSIRQALAMLAVVGLCFAFCVSARAEAILGMKLAEAQKADLFQFFHFNLKERSKLESGKTVVTYSAQCMGYPAVLSVIIDGKDETIQLMSLVLQRRFVDQSTLGVFARDLAKSFLKQGVPEADLPALKTEIDQIEFGAKKPDPSKIDDWVLETTKGKMAPTGFIEADANSTPKLPDTPTPAYAAFLGKQPSFEHDYSACKVLIRTDSAKADDQFLQMVIAPR